MTASTSHFNRDRLTWLAYSMLAYIGFAQAILGPLMPFLRTELGLNYTLGGFLPAAVASGLILTGLLGGWLSRHINRQVLFWSGGTGLAASIVMLSLSRQFPQVLLSVLVMGVSGSLAQIMIQAVLSDWHGERRATALTEANVGASLSGTLTPFVISGFQRLGLEWRAISILTSFVLVLMVIFFWSQSIPNSLQPAFRPAGEQSNLPPAFWMYWLVLFFMVAVEMSLSVWSTDFFINIVGLSRKDAVIAFGALPAAMLFGRFAGSRLTRFFPTLSLLFGALALALAGFPLFWLARTPGLNILGLFITGLGIANQYPLTMSIAVGLANEKVNQASARISLAVGSALLVAPLFLGWLADEVGLQSAFALVLVLMAVAIAVIFITNRFLLRQKADIPIQVKK